MSFSRAAVFKSALICLGVFQLNACVTTNGASYGSFIDQMVQQPSTTNNKSAAPSMAQREEVYQPISPVKGTLKGLFKGPNVPHWRAKDTGWPRVAITYIEWGKDLICWTVQADIWTDAKNKTIEKFKICDVPYIASDDVGGKVVLDARENSILYLRAQYSKSTWPTTGAERTAGPTPPAKITPSIASDPYRVNDPGTLLSKRQDHILSRIALVSGFVRPQGYQSAPDTVNDVRLWVYKFEPSGKRE